MDADWNIEVFIMLVKVVKVFSVKSRMFMDAGQSI